jgi:hypothetical protein
MKNIYVVHYTAKQWMHKPDPNGFGKCSKAFHNYDTAQQYAIKRQSMGCNTVIEVVG